MSTSLSGSITLVNVVDGAQGPTGPEAVVTIRVTAIDYDADTATLAATLVVNGVAKTTGVTYSWAKDGTAMSGETGSTLSVTAAKGGLGHSYSCTCEW